MLKSEFIKELSKRLDKEMPSSEKENIIRYYDELIEDTIEKNNKSEEEAVLALGPIDEIIKNITLDNQEKNNEEARVIDVADVSKKENKKVIKKTSMVVDVIVTIILLSLLIAIIYAFSMATIAIGFTSFIFIIKGIILAFSDKTSAMFASGIGLILLSIALMIFPLLINLSIKVFKKLKKHIKDISNTSIKKEECYHEN